MAMAYVYLTYVQARQYAALRLSDVANVFWADAEVGLYLLEALRTWNALTAFWIARYNPTITAASPNWLTTNIAGSPRVYTITDAYLYQSILYHILEPQLVVGVWAGTTQFSLPDLTQALDRRQAEIVQMAGLNMTNPQPVVTANTRSISLADTVLDIKRARFIPVSGTTLPQTLARGDSASFARFTPAYRQTTGTFPRNYGLSDIPPLTLEVDFAPPLDGTLDLIAVNSPTVTNMPTAVQLGIPDDWTWVLKYGVMMDMLGKQSEAQDNLRAKYCRARYMEGVTLLQSAPWLMEAEFNNVPVGVGSLIEKDMYDNGWEVNPNPRRVVVTSGMDYFSVCPRPTGATNLGLSLKLVQSAPVPVLDTDLVQVPRDVLDAILDYVVHLGAFKMGGAEFNDTMPLFDNFRATAQGYNQRIFNLALFDDVMKHEGQRQTEVDPRYSKAQS